MAGGLTRVVALALVIVGSGLPSGLPAQEPVIWDRQARDYLRQDVIAYGRVELVQRRESGEVWLSLGDRYPRAPLVVVVGPDLVVEFPGAVILRGKQVRVQGFILPPTAEFGDRPIVPYVRIEHLGRLREVNPDDVLPPPRSLGVRRLHAVHQGEESLGHGGVDVDCLAEGGPGRIGQHERHQRLHQLASRMG